MFGRYYILLMVMPFIFTIHAQEGWFSQSSRTSEKLNSVCFVDSNNGWIVGENGIILHTSDGGQNWIGQTSEYTGILKSVHFTDAYNGWALGGKTIIYTTDGGENWEIQFIGDYYDLNELYFINSDTGYAVGSAAIGGGFYSDEFSRILYTTDGGDNWSNQLSMKFMYIDAVHFIDQNIGWALCNKYDFGAIDYTWVLRTADGGDNWDTIYSNGNFVDVFFVNADTGWVLTDDGAIKRTTNGGEYWKSQTAGRRYYCLYFTDANTGWAAGYSAGYSGTIKHTHDGGENWSFQSTGTESIYDIYFSDADHGWAVGDEGTILHTVMGSTMVPEADIIIESVNAGKKWRNPDSLVVDITLQNTGYASADSFTVKFYLSLDTTITTEDDVYCGSMMINSLKELSSVTKSITFIIPTIQSTDLNIDYYHLCAIADADSSVMESDEDNNVKYDPYKIDIPLTTPIFADLQISGTTEGLFGVSFVDMNNGIVVGDRGTILRTADGGETWKSQSSGTMESLNGVSYCDIDHGFAVGGSESILSTTDGGDTWTIQVSGITWRYLRGVSFFDKNHGIAVGDNGTILITDNGGETWEYPVSGTGETLFSVSFTDQNYGTSVGSGGTILRTTDGGETWKNQSSGTTLSLFGVSFCDLNHGIAVGMNGSILSTTDGGETWINQSSGTTEALFGVSFVDMNNGIVVGGRGTILRTTDGGETWKMKSSGTTKFLEGVSMVNENTGTIVGGDGVILRFTKGTTAVSLEDISHYGVPSHFMLYPNYPNPFNPQTNIRIGLPFETDLTVSIYNITGRMVNIIYKGKLNSGYHDFKWNACNQPSGVYLIGIQSAEYHQISKCMLLK